MEELLSNTIRSVAENIRARSVSPVELTSTVLRRVERLGGELNAFTTVMAESALRRAQLAEDAIGRGEWFGPLHGIPITVKDLFHVEGVALTAGSRLLDGFVSDYDAAVVTRVEQAGGVIVGKTNLHEFAYGTTSASSVFGPVRNPWDKTRMAGGSSGGSAAATASGLGYASLGTDTGGSVRIPAALCGVAGLKPTYGRVSRYGSLDLAPTLDHVGILARHIDDILIVLQVIADEDTRGLSAIGKGGLDHNPRERNNERELRLGLIESTFESASEEVARVCEAALGVFREAGMRTCPVSFRRLEEIRDATYVILFAEAAFTHRDRIKNDIGRFFPDVRERFERADEISASDYLQALSVRRKAVQGLEDLFGSADLLVSPMVPIGAPTIGVERACVGSVELPVSQITTANTREWNALGCPALSLLCGFTSGGLPIGLQIIGRQWDEERVLRAGAVFQRLTDWHLRLPAQ